MPQNFFKWDNDFNTGNEIIDSQHFALVEMINDLLEISINNKLIKTETIEKTSSKLSAYIDEHFSTEKALMEKYSIDHRHREEHLQFHKDFVHEVTNQFEITDKQINPKKLKAIVEYLIRWLAYHILNTDKSLTRQLTYIADDGMTPAEAYEMEEQITETSTEPLLKALKVLYLLVSRKNKEIELKNVQLEEKVKQRTAELSEANEKLSQLLYHDVLTGLPNRRYVMAEIEKLLNNWARYRVPFSILFIDVDKFKSVNDNYGHENGDKVLQWIADLLSSTVRKTDIACRLGGDEFIVICPNTEADGAFIVGKKLNAYCSSDDAQEFEFWNPSLSIGVSTVNDLITTPSELIKTADNAMYVSKCNGGGTTSLSKD
ncbi:MULTISPECIES: GGDEF domain-containing protein [unclassified Fusibacter]|uniref:GGDEF domain-containing protein n=1 Tax=unclassified Fusibacter TaxID=2624464 RepID=UPI0010111BA6|nr:MULTISPECIES: GGDEF domain-containing protein [unclassified Fusibacter]MCK8060218.1 GGDEF domain-containing protein [Fusibacter sp. A2]NPE22359.1 diguanylate cyclase [Fusibacter sp. A1]RXV61130.1 GGDEF domain-containing protein [Fusibacter sp. A1]